MLRARSQSIADAIKQAETQIEAIEQAYTMLEGYSYEMEAVPVMQDEDGEGVVVPVGIRVVKAAE